MFRIEVVPDYLEYIATFLSLVQCPPDYTTVQKKHLVVRAGYYQLIAGQLYTMGLDQILRHCILDHERECVLWECHAGIAGGHIGGKCTAQKVLQVFLWWPTLFKDAKEYTNN